ncbi:hypothetical protein [Cellulomonas xylanilytica]|uniref:hypothetical protein n=1 Tax=Cellulomonas xylanilytica TaxID=233583 RepID=UPI0011BEEFF2|nr:hypothetical protein [Cellulomonas xylanilytica]
MSGLATTFNPAQSITEASVRMFALTSSPDVGTRGPRRSLLALADSLGIEVDSNAVNAVVGWQIAEVLDTEWREDRDYVQYQVTLYGMNTLLWAASANLAMLAQARTVTSNAALEQALLAMPWFMPARTKQEAVDRLCDLAGAPRYRLGRGAKEYVRTFPDVAARFAPHLLGARRTKHEWGALLADEFSVPWSPTAISTQGTVTKEGLNLILAGVERRANVSSAAWATAAHEGSALVAALARDLPTRWDGRESIDWMRENGSTKWYGSEWAGWFFEEQVRAILNERYPSPPVGGPRVKYGATTFDYASPTRVWDAKAHTAWSQSSPWDGARPTKASSPLWLNDARAMRGCIEEQGLGFLIVDGLAGLDVEGIFRQWIETYGARYGKQPSTYVASTGTSRPRKVEWTPIRLRALWIENLYELQASVLAGWLWQKPQPDWGAGEQRRARNDKYQARLGAAGPWTVASFEWGDIG